MQHLSLSTSQGGVVWRPPTQRHRSSGSVPRVAAAGGPLPRRRPAATAAQSGSSGSGSVQASSLSELQDGLQEAIKAEDYAAAARIRDRISEFMQEDPVLQAEARLDAAVREERFEDAAKLRDELKQLRPPSPVPAVAPALDLGALTAADTTSNTLTDGIRVTCRSFYVPSESRAGTFFFGYQINIVHESQATVKLMERYWYILNGQGRSQEVKGPGVVGEQPELAPGQSFSYQSACPLPTPKGSMEGHFEFYARDADSGQWRKSFLVKIGQFALRAD